MFIKEKVKQIDTFIFSLMLVSKFTHSSFSFGFGQGIHDLDPLGEEMAAHSSILTREIL